MAQKPELSQQASWHTVAISHLTREVTGLIPPPPCSSMHFFFSAFSSFLFGRNPSLFRPSPFHQCSCSNMWRFQPGPKLKWPELRRPCCFYNFGFVKLSILVVVCAEQAMHLIQDWGSQLYLAKDGALDPNSYGLNQENTIVFCW